MADTKEEKRRPRSREEKLELQLSIAVSQLAHARRERDQARAEVKVLQEERARLGELILACAAEFTARRPAPEREEEG